MASVIEDRIQRRYYLVPFTAKVKRPEGTPEAIGKADYISTLINTISSGLGATVGLAQVMARAFNVRARRLEALHDVRLSLAEFSSASRLFFDWLFRRGHAPAALGMWQVASARYRDRGRAC